MIALDTSQIGITYLRVCIGTEVVLHRSLKLFRTCDNHIQRIVAANRKLAEHNRQVKVYELTFY